MKRGLIVVVSLIALLSLWTPSFAGLLKKNVLKCRIVSIDPIRNEVVCRDSRSGKHQTYIVSPPMIRSLQKDKEVILISNLESNIVQSIREVRRRR